MGNFLFRGWACLSLWGAITGCSGSPADSGKVGNKPRTSEEALARLSSTQQRSFEDWKQKLIKACDAGTIFGIAGSSAEEVGIDGAVLLRQNSGSVVFSDVDQYAILTDAQSFSGTRETHVEETREVNGERNQLAAATEQKGSHCIVSLWGQKIHEVEIAQNMTIGMHWMTKRPVQAVAEIPELKSLGSSTPVSTMMGEVPSRGLDQLLSGVFQPTEAAWGFLAQRLGVPLEQIEKVFKLRSDSSNLAIRGVNAPGLWNLSYNGKFQSSMASLQEMFASPMGTLSLEVRVPIPNFQWGNARNTADSGNLKIVLDVSGVKKVNSFEYFLRNLGNRGWVAWDLPEALQCAKERAVAYGKDGLSSRRIQPSVEGMLGPCRILHAEVEKASYETGLLKSLLPARFEGVSPGAGVQYGGWDGVLAKLALEVLAQGRDIRQELDPQRQTKIMGPVASHLESLQRELLSTRNLDSWRESLLRMGLDWAFQGQEVLPARVQLILSSLDRTAVPFQVSARSLLEDLRRWPADQEETLQFAQKVDSNYLSEAQRALKFAQEIRYSYFESNIFNKIFF